MLRGELSEMQRDKAWQGKDADERQAMTAHNLNMGGADNARAAGLRANAAGLQREEDHTERRRREDRFEQALRRMTDMTPEAQALHSALGNYGEELRREQQRNERRLAELRDRADARITIEELIAAGALDRDNPEHQALFERAGIDPNQSDDDIRRDIERDAEQDRAEEQTLEDRNAEIERQLPHLDQAQRRLERGDDPADVMRDLEAAGIHIEVDNLDRDHVFDRVFVRNSELRQEVNQSADTSAVADGAGGIEVDQEIETFMQALATNQQMMMLEGAALMDAMRIHVNALSDEARAELESSNETAFLFDETTASTPTESPARGEDARDPNINPPPGSNL